MATKKTAAPRKPAPRKAATKKAAPKKAAAKKATPRKAAASTRNERTSPRIAKIASRGIRDPKSLTPAEIAALAASALNQAPDRPKPAKKARK